MSPAVLLTTSAVMTLVPSVMFLGLKTMRSVDDTRLSYELTFPSDLATAKVVTWVNALSGTLRSGPGRLLSVPTVAFEVWATDLGITHRLKVPRARAGYIVPQLRSLVPGMTVTPEDDEPEHKWTSAVELGQTNPSRTLNIHDAEALSTSVLTNMQNLRKGEALLLQWVVSPAPHEHLPKQGHDVGSSGYSVVGQLLAGSRSADKDEIADRRAKLAEPNFIGVLRVAARASDPRRAASLLANVRDSLTSIHSPHNRFKKRFVTSRALIERVSRASGSVLFPAKLSATELVALISWPIGQPHIAGLPRSRTRHLAATGTVPRVGRVIARSNFPGTTNRMVALSPIESAQHLQVVGPTGSGKTALLTNLIAQDIQAGRGVILIESKGDLFNAVLDRVPKERLHDVVLLDVNDTDYPVGFNILQGSPYVVAADIQRLFDHLYPQDARGVRVRQGFYHLILTLMMSRGVSSSMTFADLGPLALPTADQQEFSDRVVRGVDHIEELAGWWHDITAMSKTQRETYFKPLADRIWQLSGRRSIRNIIGQSASTIDLRDVIRNKKILLVNLGRATQGTDTAGLLGSILLNSVWSSVQGGAADPTNPTMLYLDELQDFLNLPIAPADMFAQARSLGLAMTVAHQFLNQLTRELQDATQNNARSTVVFQTSADEARRFAKQFGRAVTEEDFMNQARFEVIMRLATEGGVSAPMTADTLPPVDATGLGDEVRRLSRATYGRPGTEVDEEVQRRRGASPKSSASTKRTFGGKNWDN